MTIRFTCGECSSVLKINDDLAGTKGRCPKCKTKFVVPQLDHKHANANGHTDVLKGDESHGKQESELPDLHQAETDHKSALASRKTEKHPEVTPFELNPAEAVQLDDSHYDLDALGDEPVSEDEALKPALMPSFTAESVEDLDCPSIMVAHPMMPTKSILLRADNQTTSDVKTEFQKTESYSSFSDRAEKSPVSSRPIPVIPAFDPMKFLMSERSEVTDETSPANFDLQDEKPIPLREEKPAQRREEKPEFSLPFDAENEMERPSSRPINRSATAAKPVHPQPEKIDLATAAKMMKKAIRDNQADEARQREIDAKGGFDYGQLFREFGLKGLGILAGGIVVAFGLYYMADRMFSSALKLPKRGYVHGVVKLDGKPLSGAIVSFSPSETNLAGSKKERARTSVGVADDNGQFRMMYLPAENIEGVAVGNCRVWVTHVGQKGRSDVPGEWSEGGMMVQEVTAGKQKSPFEINMETKTPNRR